jgi:hypothetical protein
LRLKGAIIYSVNPVMAFTKASLPGNILDPLGAITVTSVEDFLAADSVFLKTRAGKERNILIIPSGFFMRPSPRG